MSGIVFARDTQRYGERNVRKRRLPISSVGRNSVLFLFNGKHSPLWNTLRCIHTSRSQNSYDLQRWNYFERKFRRKPYKNWLPSRRSLPRFAVLLTLKILHNFFITWNYRHDNSYWFILIMNECSVSFLSSRMTNYPSLHQPTRRPCAISCLTLFSPSNQNHPSQALPLAEPDIQVCLNSASKVFVPTEPLLLHCPDLLMVMLWSFSNISMSLIPITTLYYILFIPYFKLTNWFSI